MLRQPAKIAGEGEELTSSAQWREQADIAQEVVDQLKRFKKQELAPFSATSLLCRCYVAAMSLEN
jgi:formate hydrogenlyase subunit 4